ILVRAGSAFQAEADALLDELAYTLSAERGRIVARAPEPVADGVREEDVVGFTNLDRPWLDAAEGVHDESHEHVALDAGRTEHRRVRRARVADSRPHDLLDLVRCPRIA